MKCLLLRHCLSKLEGNNEPDTVNVQVSFACCGGTVKDSNIDQTDDNVKDYYGADAQSNLLRSESSSSIGIGKQVSQSDEVSTKESEEMACNAKDLYPSPPSAKDLSKPQILRE